MVGIPTQAGLHRHWHIDGLDHLPRDFEHEVGGLQHTSASTFPGHALHGAAEIDVKDIGTGAFHHDLCGIAHGNGVFAVYLDGNGTLFLANGEFVETAVDHADKGIGSNKF